MEAHMRHEQKKSPGEANQVMQAWQEETERAHRGQIEAENKLSSMRCSNIKKQDTIKKHQDYLTRIMLSIPLHGSNELEKRYCKLTDLLYYKQTQLETMASENAAAEFQLEKECNRVQEVQADAERSKISRRASSSWEVDTEMKTLEPLPLHRHHLYGASIQLQKAVKLIDSMAVMATRFLWRYPTVRVILFFYLVFVHLFLMYLLHCLQEHTDSLAVREVAESMGLSNPNLP